MSRINTNVSSLIAQKTLARSNAQLQESLTRLSTGLRINVGKDDPAGLIASEVLRSDIIAVQRAVTNSERANQLIGTADSALGQVSALLNDVRGLVSDAANTGALSEEQIAANQLQIDSSLEAIDRIAQTTSFQGRRLLDGSLDFITSSAGSTGFSSGTVGNTVGVKASGSFADPDGSLATGTLTRTGVAAAGTITNTDTLIFTADAVGLAFNGLDVTFTVDATPAGSEIVNYDDVAGTVNIRINAASTTTQIRTALNAHAGFAADFTVTGAGGATTWTAGNNAANLTVGGLDTDVITFTADQNGTTYNGLDVSFVVDASAAGSETVDFVTATKAVTVHVHANSTTTQIVTALNNNGQFGAEYTASGAGARIGYTAANNATDVTAGGTLPNLINLEAVSTGTTLNGLDVIVAIGGAVGAETAVYAAGPGTLTLTVNAASTTTDVVTAINNQVTQIRATAGAGATGVYTAGTTNNVLAGGVNGNQFTLTALNSGTAYDGVTVNFTTSGAVAAGAEVITYDSTTKILSITHNAASTVAQVIASITADVGTLFSGTALDGTTGVFTDADDEAGVTTGGSAGGVFSDLKVDQANFGTQSQISVQVNVDQQATRAKLVYDGGTLTSDLILQVGGQNGFEVFNFGSSTTTTQIASAINLVSDATGVQATVNGSNLELTSTEYGSDAFVQAKAISGAFVTTLDDLTTSADRDTGTDVQLRINGVQATGDGLKASLNTSTLDLSFSVGSTLVNGSNFSFTITGGGANFQLGPDVVSNQQARLGIQGVSTATLGGVSGTLFELRSGGAKDLTTDTKGAAKVVDEVITSVTSLRGRLGAFQRTTLETNIFTLNDTLANLTEAESSIRDADFAAESARLTRAQILVQSGTSVLAIANSNPQNVLALLR